MENRMHSHTVDPAAVTSSASGAHSHTVDPASVSSSIVDLSHTHTVNPAVFTTPLGGTHNHAWAIWSQTNLEWTTYFSDGITQNSMVNYSNGFTNTGSGSYPIEDNGGANVTEYTADSSHTHDIDVPATLSGAASVNMAHSHTVDIGVTTTSTVTDHTHSVDVGATTSSAVSATTPYVQLLACRKN
jgi:hypothetical protein